MWIAPLGICHWKTQFQLPSATVSFPDSDSLERESEWPSLRGGMLVSTVIGRPIVGVVVRVEYKEVQGNFWGDRNVLNSDCGDSSMGEYMCQN